MESTAKLEDQLPDGITVLQNQGGGHMFNAKKGMVGIMQHSDGCLLKPVCAEGASEQLEDDEVRFYEQLSLGEDAVDRELLPLIARYYGTQKVPLADREVLCMKVENFTHGFRRACVIDIKVGRNTSIPTATEQKRKHEASKYLGTRASVGFSVPGMTVYDVTSGTAVQHGKEFGKQLTADTVEDAFRLFLNASCGAAVLPICDSLLSQLRDIQRWFSRQRKYRFFASSILLTYDAAALERRCGSAELGCVEPDSAEPDSAEPDSLVAEARPVARMIDFAHAWPADGLADDNYVQGLDNIVLIVGRVRDRLARA